MEAAQGVEVGEWLGQHVPEWVTCTPVAPIYGLPEKILGSEDAVVEWRQDEKPVNVFTPIQTYTDLKKPDALFLFGRRGTGKTALLRMLDFESYSGAVPPYKCCWVFDTHSVILALTTHIRGTLLASLPTPDLANILEPVWRWYIQLSAMCGLVSASRNFAGEAVEVRTLRAHLEAMLGKGWDERPREKLREVLQQHLARALRQDDPTAGSMAAAVATAFAGDDHRRATNALKAVLKERPCLLLMDAGEVYRVREDVSSATITSLIAAVYFYASDWRGVGLYAKAAFPSEILPHIFPYNKGKMQGHIVLITWTHHDLVTLIAKRYYNALNTAPDEGTLASFDAYDNARKFLYRYLPSSVTPRQGGSFDTIAYLVRHTQKTPRQIILLLNTVLTVAQRRGVAIDGLREDASTIVEGIHARLDHLVEDALDMHKYVYEGAETLIQRVLSQQPSHFQDNQLDRMLKKISDLRYRLGVERFDVKRVLLETGVLGIAHAVHQVRDQYWILEAVFEYQLKQTIAAASDSLYVVHPMFHEWLQTKIDRKTFVYPLAYEAEERNVLQEYGVRA